VNLREKLLVKPIIKEKAENKDYYGFGEKQIERAYKHIVIDIPMTEIARQENISVSAVRGSITSAIKKINLITKEKVSKISVLRDDSEKTIYEIYNKRQSVCITVTKDNIDVSPIYNER
jgi:predicted DNA-binding protein YlxM (UPF0122 family)